MLLLNLFNSLVVLGALTIAPLIIDAARFEFSQPHVVLSKEVKNFLNGLSPNQWQEFVDSGIDSIDRQRRLEENLLRSNIIVRNGSLSHAQLLDTLPNKLSKHDSEVAMMMLKSSLYVYNTQCVTHGINVDECRTFLEGKPLPDNSAISKSCQRLIRRRRDGHHPFRRLLPRHYQNGFDEMFGEDHLPAAWPISMGLCDRPSTLKEDQFQSNLALVQWAQFVEHDLSKPVVTSMRNGEPIECCNTNQNHLQPRFRHPACAPILSKEQRGWPTCLNYVRSALAVGHHCNFGAAEQLNQATSSLDLSQLYGFTTSAEHKMRMFKRGLLKSTTNSGHASELLPLTTDDDGHTFCAAGGSVNISTCFAAGDSRVNNNPYSILIYTTFLRNHNRLARQLTAKNPSWDDEELFQAAKTINVDTYRRVVMEEWLPMVLGNQLAADVLARPPTSTHERNHNEVSNEFGVAAIRFYFSMLPNALQDISTVQFIDVYKNNLIPLKNLFVLEDEIYKPQLEYTAQKLNDILSNLLHQKAMKMDASYVSSLIWDNPSEAKPTHADILAFDIQRGRDHGLQPYYKYLEACNNVKINSWTDFERFLTKDHLDKLKNVYNSWADVDLIVGGISERTEDGIVGPTFSCILFEQFARTHQRHQKNAQNYDYLLSNRINGSQLLCLNSDVQFVPEKIFQVPSDSNHLIDCKRIQ